MLKEIIVEKSRRHKTAVYPLTAFAGAAILAYSSAGLVSAPLICAFSGALSPVCSAAFSLGAMLTLLTGGDIAGSGFIFCALVLASVGRWIMRDDTSSRNAAFITFVSMAFSGVVFGFLVDRSAMTAAVNLVKAALGAAASYFICEASVIAGGTKAPYCDRGVLTAFAGVFVLLVSQLCGLSVSVINIGIAAACAVTLCACRFFGSVGGVVCGVLTSAGVTAAFPDMGLQTVFFGAAGLAAGFASGFSRVSVAALFSAANLVGQLAVGMNDVSFCIQADTVIGGAIFLLLPERFIAAAGKYFTGAETDSGEFAGKEMEFAAKSLCDIRKNISGVITALSSRTKPYSMTNDVSGKVCSKCRNKLDCWEKNFERTNGLFRKIENGKVTDINNPFTGFECPKSSELGKEFERAKREAAVYKMMSARIEENRTLLFSQMEASEEIVLSLSQRMNINISKSMTSNLCRILSRYDIPFNSAVAYYSHSNRLIAEVYINGSDGELVSELCRTLTRELGIEFEFSRPFECDGETRLRFNQKTKYGISCVHRQMSAVTDEPSGDCFGCFTDGLGFAYVFIADGMGSGSKASVDSEISSRLFKRLIRSGLSCECALKTINSVMLTKSADESFTTLDIAKIDLETGSLTLYKSGGAATLISYGDAVVMYALPSNPVGIIPDPVICSKECSFDPGNVLVMMSDGVPEAAYPYIKEQLGAEVPFEESAENICVYSHKITSGTMPDDVTVGIITLYENE